MKIFCTYSSDVKPRGLYEDCLKNAGHEIVTGSARKLLNADALLICISGKENRDIKENLNLALDRELPVAYVIEDGGVPDAGLNIQLAIAVKIPAGSDSEIPVWLNSVSGKIQARKKKKSIKIAVGVLAAVLLTAGAVVLAVTLMNQNGANRAEPALTKEQQLGIDVEELKASEKIDISGKGLDDISFLAECKTCTELDISGNEISDISVLSELENIRVLNVSGNRIKDINVLLTLKNLTEVDISDNPISNYTATSFLEGVKVKQ